MLEPDLAHRTQIDGLDDAAFILPRDWSRRSTRPSCFGPPVWRRAPFLEMRTAPTGIRDGQAGGLVRCPRHGVRAVMAHDQQKASGSSPSLRSGWALSRNGMALVHSGWPSIRAPNGGGSPGHDLTTTVTLGDGLKTFAGSDVDSFCGISGV
jgi:hypothetical protein